MTDNPNKKKKITWEEMCKKADEIAAEGEARRKAERERDWQEFQDPEVEELKNEISENKKKHEEYRATSKKIISSLIEEAGSIMWRGETQDFVYLELCRCCGFPRPTHDPYCRLADAIEHGKKIMQEGDKDE